MIDPVIEETTVGIWPWSFCVLRQPTKRARQPDDEIVAEIKRDWYGLDFIYLPDHLFLFHTRDRGTTFGVKLTKTPIPSWVRVIFTDICFHSNEESRNAMQLHGRSKVGPDRVELASMTSKKLQSVS